MLLRLDDIDIGERAFEHIAKVHGRAMARAWFEAVQTDDYNIVCRWKRNDDGSVTLHVGTKFRQEQIIQRFLPTLKEALGNDVKVVR